MAAALAKLSPESSVYTADSLIAAGVRSQRLRLLERLIRIAVGRGVLHETPATRAGGEPFWRTTCAPQPERLLAGLLDTFPAMAPELLMYAQCGPALAGVLTGTVDPERFAMLSGTESLPFKPGKHRRAAVKVIDPRGNEVMRVHGLG